MANTYSQIYVQFVFAVKGRKSFIKESFREELQKYFSGIINNKKQKLYAIYCMPDHTHIFISMAPDITMSDLMRDVKSSTSGFIKDKGWVNNFEWQKGLAHFHIPKQWQKRL
jgi:REP element-mobilizing transposase RayT